MRLATSHVRRWAFTLIEMLVVIALILILMTIAAAMFPRFAENQKIIKGADQITSMLLNAKQRALRDRRATGVRLVLDQNGTARELVFIQQIDDYSRGRCAGGQGAATSFLVNFPGADFTGDGSTFQVDQPDLAPVQHGDYLEVNGGGLVRMIDGVNRGTQLFIVGGPRVPEGPYRIIRQPRRIPGEPPLELPQNIVVDLDPARSRDVPLRRVYTGRPNTNPRPSQDFVEILFAPGGGVVGRGTSSGANIILWVRDTTKDNAALEGSPLLVSIHTRTGMIAVHPVNTRPGAGEDFYSFTRDGRSSGL